MGFIGLQNSCHPVWQRVTELVDEVVGYGMEGHLAGIPKLLQVLRLGPPSFLLDSSPDLLNNIHIWRLCWPSLKELDLLPPEEWAKRASLASTPPGAVRWTSKLSSQAVVLRGLPDLGLSWMSPVSL